MFDNITSASILV